jgi:hypothetical protein
MASRAPMRERFDRWSDQPVRVGHLFLGGIWMLTLITILLSLFILRCR